MFLSLVELTVVKYKNVIYYGTKVEGGGEAGWELHFFLLAPRSDSTTYDM